MSYKQWTNALDTVVQCSGNCGPMFLETVAQYSGNCGPMFLETAVQCFWKLWSNTPGNRGPMFLETAVQCFWKLWSNATGICIHIAIGAGIGAIVGAVGSAVSQYVTTGTIDPAKVLLHAGSGALAGGLTASGVGLVGAIVGNMTISTTTYVFEQAIDNEPVTREGLLFSAVVGGIVGLIGGKGLNGARQIGVHKTYTQYLKTAVSPKKIARYTAGLAKVKADIIETSLRYLAAGIFGYGSGIIKDLVFSEKCPA